MGIINPLEQFRIMVLQKLYFFGTDISLTNNTIILFFVSVFFVFLFYINYYRNSYMLNRWSLTIEMLYNFVLQLVRQQVGNLIAVRYFPLILFTFCFILTTNLLGLLPYSFTVTGHIIFTFQIAFSLFLGITIINIFNNQFQFFNLFVPSGIPKPLIPFLVVIEVVSYVIRPFSLSVRLFANMLAGHTLLNIIATFIFSIFKSYSIFVVIPILFIVFIIILEFCIAIIQAYIFSILLCIYINDVYNLNH